MNDADRCLAALAESQYGVVSREQALTAGLTEQQLRWRIKERQLVAVFPSVYRVAGAPVTGRQRALAASLWLGDTALISFLTSATLLRLDGCKTRELHVSAPRSCRQRTNGSGLVLHKVLALPRSDRVVVDGIPCTTATRTLIDCAASLSDEALEVAFESARRMGLTALPVLAARAAELCGPGKPGSRAIRKLLAHQQPGEPALQYRLEVKLARLLRGSAVPILERQVEVGRYRIDFACRTRRVGIECEGFEYHGNRLAWKRDKRRTAWLESQHWRLTFVTWDDVTRRPEETVDRIAFALGV